MYTRKDRAIAELRSGKEHFYGKELKKKEGEGEVPI